MTELRDEDIVTRRLDAPPSGRSRVIGERSRPEARPRLDLELQQILGIASPKAFLGKIWQRRPWVSERRRGAFERYFSLAILDQLLSTRSLRWDHVTILPDVLPLAALDRNPDLRHASLFIEEPHADFEALAELVHLVERSFASLAMSSAVLSPRRSRSSDRHHDAFDQLVFQVSGKKRWKIHGRGKVLLETTLEEGTVLYLPIGFDHEAVGTDDHSLHVAVSLHPPSWHRVVGDGWRHVTTAGAQGGSVLRAPVRTGAELGRKLRALDPCLRLVDFEQLAEDASFQPPFDHTPVMGRYQRGSLLRYRPPAKLPREPVDAEYASRGLRHVVRKTPAGIVLLFRELKVRFDVRAERELAFALGRHAFTAGDAPADLDRERLTAVAEALTRAGFLLRRIRA